MGIRFHCDNPKCKKLILVPDEMAGKQDRCPGCGQLITIPAAETIGGGGSDKQDAAYFQALQFLEGQTAAQAKHGQAKIARCQACCRLIPEGVSVCPFCGRLGPLAVVKASSEASGAAAPSAGVFVRSCLAALAHPRVEFRSVFFAAMSLMAWYLLQRLLFNYFPQLQPSQRWAKLVFVGLGAPLALITAGYCLQAALDHIRRAAPETPEAEAQKTDLPGILYTGLMAAPLIVVYVLPVVTIPLLPVALLALSMTRDARALNLRWSVRTAVACGEEFAFLWLLMLVSAGTLALLFVVIVLLASWIGAGVASVVGGAEGRILAEMVHLLGAGSAGVLACFLACGPIQCVGLVARHRPDILTWLPKSASPVVTALAIAASIALLALLVAVVI